MPKVSVIIPIYNAEAYIAKTIESVLQQTYTNWELLLIDDGSPDNSVQICQQFNDPRLRIIRQANRGLAGARNTGIRNSRGEYIGFLDADDLWLPDKITQHLAHLERLPQVGVSFSSSAFIDESGKPLNAYLKPRLKGIDIPYLLRESPVGNGSAAIIRRAVFDEIGFQDNLYGEEETYYFDENFRQSEDMECWLRIALTTDWQFQGIPEALTLYRVNPGGLSANWEKQLASWERVREKARTIAPERVIPWENKSRAYILRYLARSAVRMGSGKVARDLVNKAIATDWRILIEEPQRTIPTAIAAYLLRS